MRKQIWMVFLAVSMLVLISCSGQNDQPGSPDGDDATTQPSAAPTDTPTETITCTSSDDFTDSSTLENCWVVGNNKTTKMAIFDIEPSKSLFVMDDPVAAPFNGSPAIWKNSESQDLTITLKIDSMADITSDGILFGFDSATFTSDPDKSDVGKYVYFYLFDSTHCVVISNTLKNNVVPQTDCNISKQYPFYMRIVKVSDKYNFYFKNSETPDFVLLNNGEGTAQGSDYQGPAFTKKYRVLIAPIVSNSSKDFFAKIDSITFDVGSAVDQK